MSRWKEITKKGIASAMRFLVESRIRLSKRRRFIINRTSNRILYVGHSYHSKTKSTSFLIELLRERFEVEVIWDDSWNGGVYPDLSHVDSTYFAVVFFQSRPPVGVLDALPIHNILLIPMYDSTIRDPAYWFPYRHCKFVNFSRTLHHEMESWGMTSLPVQYFPPPRTFRPGDPQSVFFWQRTSLLHISLVEVLCGNQVRRLFLHKALDPGHEFRVPTQEQVEKYSISVSSWFPNREDLDELLGRCALYVAPREAEGIGMSFLEAMASGKAVLAANRPTMSEYIVDGFNGYLYDLDDPVEIELSQLRKVQERAHQSIAEGWPRWLNDQKALIEYLYQENP